MLIKRTGIDFEVVLDVSACSNALTQFSSVERIKSDSPESLKIRSLSCNFDSSEMIIAATDRAS